MMHITLTENHLQVKCSVLKAAGVLLATELDFHLNAGHVYLLSGVNGAGKTTLLRALSNQLLGHSVIFKPEYGLSDDMLVHRHLEIVLQHLRCQAIEIESLLKQVGLSDWQFERIGTLSSGQRARLGLCILLSGHFRVWLLDEPLNALDMQGCEVLGKALAQHLKSGGFVLMASHIDAQQVLQHLPNLPVHHYQLVDGQLKTSGLGQLVVHYSMPVEFQECGISLLALFRREFTVLFDNPQTVFWGALFHWIVLSFFGIGLRQPDVELTQVAVWISVLLAVLLGAKDWFFEDHRIGWIRFIAHVHSGSLGMYWLVRVLYTALAQVVVLVPVTGIVALQFGLELAQVNQLIVALIAGLWAMLPLLGIVSLLVMLTRGGAVLTYLLALPLLVPVLIFGLEASRAIDFGRSEWAPLAVLFSMGLLAYLLGPFLAKRLIQLIQE
jgi:heme exporter protein A